MPKKKAAPSGYLLYMLEVRDEIEEREGYRPSMEELRTLASPGWQALPPEEKALYNRKAKEDKKIMKEDLTKKFNSLGIAFESLDAQAKEREETHASMLAIIRDMVQNQTRETVMKTRFYVSHVNYYYKVYENQEEWYCPCEISIIEFSILDGITNKYHKILHQGVLPLGERANAKDHAQRFHGIYVSDTSSRPGPKKEENMVKVFSEIVFFLRGGVMRDSNGREVLPPVFTMPTSIAQNHSTTAVENALNKFRDATHERRDLFRVFLLPQLVFELKLKFDETFKQEYGVPILENEINKDLFATAPDIECKFHEDSENGMWCSQSITLRWVYTVLDQICLKAGVELIPGKHVPPGLKSIASVPKGRSPWDDEDKSLQFEDDDDNFQTVEKFKQTTPLRMKAVQEEVRKVNAVPPPRVWGPPVGAHGGFDSGFPPLSGFPALGEDVKTQRQNKPRASSDLPKSFGRGKIFANQKR